MCIEANHYLSKDMDTAMKQAEQDEKSPLGKQILGQLQENLKIAADDMIPICQDTGMAVIFLEIGQDVHLEGGLLEEAVNEGVRQGYTEGFLRKSVVKDPLIRENTKDNTPAVLHTKIVAGDKVKIKVAPKGFGSENMSRVFMLKPAEGIEGVKHAILTAVRDAGPNACPPMVVGVGIGGTFEKCALMAKEALTREVGVHSDIPYVKDMEEEMLVKINSLGIGPGGLGGTTTALAVNINTYPTHIAGLPVGINICCHVNRHVVREQENLPIDIQDQIIYYMGPSPAREGRPIGSAGPTTASRMDKYTPQLLDLGMGAMIGKGKRTQDVIDAVIRNGAVYFAAVGGAGALLSKCITKSEVVAYDDLGTEAIRKLQVENFPVIVVIDSEGNNLYESAIKEYCTYKNE